MSKSNESRFVYVTYIRTTPERLWSALTDTNFASQYWFGMRPEAEWRAGGPWKLTFPDGRVADQGEIGEFDPPRRLVIRWQHQLSEKAKAEGWSTCTMELAASGEAVKLTVTHAIGVPESDLIGKVSGGWPQVLANLKSILETGRVALEKRFA